MIFKAKIGTENEAKRTHWIEKILLTIVAGARILDAGADELKYKSIVPTWNMSHRIFVSIKEKVMRKVYKQKNGILHKLILFQILLLYLKKINHLML